MVTFQRSLEAREQKKVRWSQVWTVGRLGDGGDACLGQIIGDNEGSVGWGIVMMQLPIVSNVWSDPVHPFFEPLEDLHILCKKQHSLLYQLGQTHGGQDL